MTVLLKGCISWAWEVSDWRNSVDELGVPLLVSDPGGSEQEGVVAADSFDLVDSDNIHSRMATNSDAVLSAGEIGLISISAAVPAQILPSGGIPQGIDSIWDLCRANLSISCESLMIASVVCVCGDDWGANRLPSGTFRGVLAVCSCIRSSTTGPGKFQKLSKLGGIHDSVMLSDPVTLGSRSGELSSTFAAVPFAIPAACVDNSWGSGASYSQISRLDADEMVVAWADAPVRGRPKRRGLLVTHNAPAR